MSSLTTAARLRFLILMAMGILSVAGSPAARAFSLNLDSIAAMGRFPKFCIDTYRWGDRFFNGYDSAYVAPTGYRFNVKFKTDSWLEYDSYRFENNQYQMNMVSYPSTQAGLWLTYMAVSVGYDVNVSQMLNLTHSSRKRFNFQFNCMLFSADLYIQSSNAMMRIRSFGPTGHTKKANIDFNDMDSRIWGLDTYYFFNHKHYSQAAAFNYGRVQRKSSGSLFAGLSISGQSYKFNFSTLPPEILNQLPASWPQHTYIVHAHNYAFKLGYGYNKVLSRRCIIGVSEAPSIGVRYGYIGDPEKPHTTFYAYNRFRASFVFNHRHWFAGVVGDIDTDLFSDRDHMFVTNLMSLEISVGFRFNLW